VTYITVVCTIHTWTRGEVSDSCPAAAMLRAETSAQPHKVFRTSNSVFAYSEACRTLRLPRVVARYVGMVTDSATVFVTVLLGLTWARTRVSAVRNRRQTARSLVSGNVHASQDNDVADVSLLTF
jgi:hypothetical protein